MAFQIQSVLGSLETGPGPFAHRVCTHARACPFASVPWCREGWSRGWDLAWSRGVQGDEVPSLRLGPATGWGFPPDAAVRAGWCWVLGTAPSFGTLETMLGVGR